MHFLRHERTRVPISVSSAKKETVFCRKKKKNQRKHNRLQSEYVRQTFFYSSFDTCSVHKSTVTTYIGELVMYPIFTRQQYRIRSFVFIFLFVREASQPRINTRYRRPREPIIIGADSLEVGLKFTTFAFIVISRILRIHYSYGDTARSACF